MTALFLSLTRTALFLRFDTYRGIDIHEVSGLLSTLSWKMLSTCGWRLKKRLLAGFAVEWLSPIANLGQGSARADALHHSARCETSNGINNSQND